MSFQSPQALNNVVPTKNHNFKTIVFIDTSIANWADIIQKIKTTIRVIVIGSQDDGIQEISKILNQNNFQEVHLISSGSPGCIYLGNSELSINTLNVHSSEIAQWFFDNEAINLVKSPRIFIHSYNFDRGDVGKESVAKLNKITKAQIFMINNLWEHSIFQ